MFFRTGSSSFLFFQFNILLGLRLKNKKKTSSHNLLGLNLPDEVDKVQNSSFMTAWQQRFPSFFPSSLSLSLSLSPFSLSPLPLSPLFSPFSLSPLSVSLSLLPLSPLSLPYLLSFSFLSLLSLTSLSSSLSPLSLSLFLSPSFFPSFPSSPPVLLPRVRRCMGANLARLLSLRWRRCRHQTPRFA
jgi:hypothetical protein